MITATQTYTTRVLPQAEWSKLEATNAAGIWPHLDPQWAAPVVVEQDGQIVGSCLLLLMLHPECLWIAPAHRKRASVARRLWGSIQTIARGCRFKTMAASAETDEMRAILSALGATPWPAEAFLMPVKESPCLQP